MQFYKNYRKPKLTYDQLLKNIFKSSTPKLEKIRDNLIRKSNDELVLIDYYKHQGYLEMINDINNELERRKKYNV